ncbi:GGDEF domain-containing protein (plasmid) [Paenibacillus rhizovicinus]|uniref:GGDEF domain-containing protein n=1 Tax=Paenibacillus rhizovicinus TaxID=2704463 RepID=A0A6C0PB66_9BACL|nr:GGDEF domain-containing protein [Paenibacillus rhizovicinus]QHW35729.1 GGDEF domain-containing protein [Paenibacillus rhizovicinus]
MNHLILRLSGFMYGGFTSVIVAMTCRGGHSEAIISVALAISAMNYYLIGKLTLKKHAMIDTLTKAFNRLAWEMDLKRRDRQEMAVLALDLDHFKSINDTFGHVMGDSVLQQVGAVVRQHIRPADVFYRYGGEEFVIVLHDVDLQIALDRGQSLLELIKSKVRAGEQEVTCSIGVAQGNDLAETFKEADQALYLAKQQGRNQVKCL